jgi:polysaccharide pyruvyl transferase WcaK-like protein
MRILVIHAWMRGNLGDVLQLSVLLSALRELAPRVLDLAGYPGRPAEATREIVSLADRYVADDFAWYWKLAPARLQRFWIEPRWRRRRAALFGRYDAIVCAPGPYLAYYDARAPGALCDLTIASDLGLPIVLSSHSIGPLGFRALSAVQRATVRVAREPKTYQYLRDRGIPCCLSADLAFLYPYDRAARPPALPPPYRLVFLRSNNMKVRDLRSEHGAIFSGSRMLVEPSREPTVLATSDPRRDQRFLASAARRLGVRSLVCRTVPELVAAVTGSSSVVSDRYHPAICAAVLGKPARVLPNREPHKMHGLQHLLQDRTIGELQDLARAGLKVVQAALRNTR